MKLFLVLINMFHYYASDASNKNTISYDNIQNKCKFINNLITNINSDIILIKNFLHTPNIIISVLMYIKH